MRFASILICAMFAAAAPALAVDSPPPILATIPVIQPRTENPQLDAAFAAAAAGDGEKAVQLLRPLAEAGDVRAQLTLGQIFWNGKITTRDNAEAAHWFQKAADLGSPRAQSVMGIFHLTGDGVPADDAKAAEWLDKAATGGDYISQYTLGQMYIEGRGVRIDPVKAYICLTLARDNGKNEDAAIAQTLTQLARGMKPASIAQAQFEVGQSFESGRGVRLDLIAASTWYARAAHAGSRVALKRQTKAPALPPPVIDTAVHPSGVAPGANLEQQRAYIGLSIIPINDDIVAALNLKSRDGVYVAELAPDQAGVRGGLRPGDIIRAFNGAPVRVAVDLTGGLAKAHAGDKLVFGVERNAKAIDIVVMATARPLEPLPLRTPAKSQ